MKTPPEEALVSIPLVHYHQDNKSTTGDVTFIVTREKSGLRAVPQLTTDERKATGLPKELVFVYYNQCILNANNMEDETLEAIKKIILELEVQDYFD